MTPTIISLTDCTDPNASARQSARLAALFGQAPVLLPLSGPDPHGAAALTLLDALLSTGLTGGTAEPVVVLVNLAPRDGHWPNGAPFCYFRYGANLVVSTYNPRVLAPLRRYLGIESVEVTDVREVVSAAAAEWAEFKAAEVELIARTQFRSLWYVPLLAKWLVDGRPVPSRKELIEVEPVGGPVRVAVVDNFGNCKLDVSAEELARRAGGRSRGGGGGGSADGGAETGGEASEAGEAGEAREAREAEKEKGGPGLELTSSWDGTRHRIPFYDRLPDVPAGRPGLTTGSSGCGFAELVIRGGSAADVFGLREGDGGVSGDGGVAGAPSGGCDGCGGTGGGVGGEGGWVRSGGAAGKGGRGGSACGGGRARGRGTV